MNYERTKNQNGKREGKGEVKTQGETVIIIPLEKLHPFRNHPFKVRDDADMKNVMRSIQEVGVLQPAIVRPDNNGEFEILSGHRRHYACKKLGFESLSCIIRDMDDDSATILMVDSNLQREEILPSERAFAFKMKMEAMKRHAGRCSKNGGQIGHHYNGKKSRELIAEEVGENARNIQRYIRLTFLNPELLQLVDDKLMGFNPAYELSFLDDKQQKELLSAIDYAQAIPSLSQAQRLKKLALLGELTQEDMYEILSEEKKQDVDRVVLKHDILKQFFPKSYTPRQMEETIIKLLEEWQQKRG
ncbi:ParB/RepB/Spo0J family partition protein [Pseudobutyrivibrio xylanivorans]|uniref:Chromosome partitioning protein, ParB family n=1 Tax=Pseudobutyrivibrio xylanivorans TaxID=185007 RepID=A0A1G5RV20_PSEXY|nr:ParB/RepB/Spo0J family partition protein [Pseudobutyrivibrio xylanivorans]SCZ77952.1 chromosome partitioning protein, ParB family [Pseudobutyrivibrio xylanivorans]